MHTFQMKVALSNRHIHLSREDQEILFGPGRELTLLKELSQPGQYACNETVTLVGPKGKMDVRVLGPNRKNTQVELAMSDTYVLGVKPPVRDSGDVEGTPGIEIQGPMGKVLLEKGVIIAARHIHMKPEDAQEHGLKDGDHVRVQIPGPRGGCFSHMLVRVSPSYALDMHIDVDEANAFGLKNGDAVEVIVD